MVLVFAGVRRRAAFLNAGGESGARKGSEETHNKGVEGERLAHDIFQLAESVLVGYTL